jgi:hypothetical protein
MRAATVGLSLESEVGSMQLRALIVTLVAGCAVFAQIMGELAASDIRGANVNAL